MDMNYSQEELSFRDEVRAWFRDNVPVDLRDKTLANHSLSKEEIRRWHKILARKGWIAPAWPEAWGGPGWNATQRYIFDQEWGLAGAPEVPTFGLTMCAQVLLKFGTEEQKKRFLPPIYNGDEFWAQGYSEPESGSDLASVKTRAERKGDKYIVNGQKTWTTKAHFADWIFCLVRTDPSVKKQEGISFVLMDIRTPGITVRPLYLMDGGHDVNEVFLDNVEVPVENLVHEEGKGWTVAKYLLGHERMGTGKIGLSNNLLHRVKTLAAQQPDGAGGSMMDDARFRDRLSRVEIQLMALEITNLRYLDAMRTGRPPGAEVSLLKIRGVDIQQQLQELLMQAAGALAAPVAAVGEQAATPFDDLVATFAPRYANLRKTSIYAGSNEIQRNIIAKQTLGL